MNPPMLVQVENSTVEGVTDLETGRNVSDNRAVATRKGTGFLSKQVQRAIQGRRAHIVVKCDKEYGYPPEIFMNEAVITEDELLY